MTDLVDIALKYFETFTNKDLEGLKEMFAENISLRDWEVEAKGIKDVLNANSDIFDSVNHMEVIPLRVWDFVSQEDNVVVAELKIELDDNEIELVTDILEFDKNNKIKAIRAYKGN